MRKIAFRLYIQTLQGYNSFAETDGQSCGPKYNGKVCYLGKEKVIDLTSFQKGVYLIQTTRHNYTTTEKIILH